jgi:hypothetical protein
MPELSAADQAKLTTLEEMLRAGQKVRFTEIITIYWPAPDGTKTYAHTQIDMIPGFTVLAPLEIYARLLTSKGGPFQDITRTAAISDDTVDLNLSDIDGEISRLCYLYGAGVRVQVAAYYPEVELTLPAFTGTLRSPKDANGRTLRLSVTSGWRSPKLLLPRRLPAPGCMFIFGALLSSQEEIDLHRGCPYNAHLGGSIGVPGFTDCLRDSSATCAARLLTTRYFPGFKTVLEIQVVGQTSGPNLLSIPRGNDASLTEPLRVIYGERLIKALRLLAYAPENNTNHPDKGFVRALFEVAEGTLDWLTEFRMNNALVGLEHMNLRLGELGQAPTSFSPNIGTYSGTAVAFGRIQGDFRNVSASDLSATIRARGLKTVRVYSSESSYAEQYATNRADCLLDMHCNKRWGFGEDYVRFDLLSVIECREWFNEFVIFTDPNGNNFSGTRSTFNAELTARATQTQIEDVCTAGRLGLPIEHNGKKVFTPLREETIDDSIPYFTDTGPDANICVDSGGLPLASWSYVGDDELVNQYTVTFEDASNGFISTPLIFGDQRQQLAAGRAWGDTTLRIINKEVNAFGVTNMPEAARLGNLLLYLGPRDTGGIKNNLKVVYTTWFSQTLNVRHYRLVKLRLRGLTKLFESLGIAGFEYFRVMSTKRRGDLKVELTVQAYPVDFYEQMEAEAPPVPGQVLLPNPGGTPFDRPCSIGFASLTHTDSNIVLQLEEC